MSTAALALVTAWAAALLATGAAVLLARRIGFMAPFNPIVPQEREPAALGGGAALFAGLSAGLWAAGALALAAALIPALLVGLFDDLRPLRPLVKFLLQCAVSALGVAMVLAGPASVAAFPWLFVGGTLLAVVLMNGINFLDVSDGYAGLVSAISFAGLAWLGDSAAAAACGACLGFLFWNWPPARIYMGDAGGQVLGLAGALLILGQVQPGWAGAWIGLACFGVALFEIVLVVAVRLRRRVPFWQGSPDHSALRLQARGFTKRAAALCAAAVQLVLVAAAVAAASAAAP